MAQPVPSFYPESSPLGAVCVMWDDMGLATMGSAAKECNQNGKQMPVVLLWGSQSV
jgi:hypothetical protein